MFKNNFIYSNLTAWDLLRICVYGFNAFCVYFLNKYPDRFISSLWVSGSAIESLFSQYKRSAGGKLDGANYAISPTLPFPSNCQSWKDVLMSGSFQQSTPKTQLIKQTVSAHHSGSGYRDLSLDTFESDIALKRKKYAKNKKCN